MKWQQIRTQILERDSYLCQSCFNAGGDVHHVIPRRLGGRDVPENLMSVCDRCHGLIELKHLKPDEEKSIKFSLLVPDYISAWLDKERGDIPRSRYIMRLLEKAFGVA